MRVLKNIWFKRSSKSSDHQDRLEHFYKDQAAQYDKFRENFLWGRRDLLAALAARFEGRKNLIWVDMGSGTGRNCEMMLMDFLPRSAFQKIYLVDLTPSLCAQARRKVQAHGWEGLVEVVEGDACTWRPPVEVDIVSFSYSLTMIPPFHDAIDNATTFLKDDGLLGVADFYVSGKYDFPMRQMSWFRRFFWRCIFDTDGIDIGPERRNYLDHHLHRLYEVNKQGSIPYVPYLRAPYYFWVGRKKTEAELRGAEVEERVEAPSLFPPTFLYTQSWEDPEPDLPVLGVQPGDVALTLTSGGCNSLNLALEGATVYSVDCNPAQNALLELKTIAIKQLPYDDVWLMFGEGVHPNMPELYQKKLAPFLTETSRTFWDSRLHYFQNGLYFQGGMGTLVWFWVKFMQPLLLLSGSVKAFTEAETLEEQVAVYESVWLVRMFTQTPTFILHIIQFFVSIVFLNRFVMWYGGGVPMKQLECIQRDGVPISTYVARTFHGAALYSHLAKHNYFYLNCMTGKYTKQCCPSYLEKANFKRLKAGLANNSITVSNFFVPELLKRKYNKVIFMDHADWLSEEAQMELVKALKDQVVRGGKAIWRSASLVPPYAAMLEANGFRVKCVQRFDQLPETDNLYMDRVNMYASFYVATRK